MEKKNYVAPTLSYIGPDVNECMETNTPMLAAVGVSVATAATANVLSRVW